MTPLLKKLNFKGQAQVLAINVPDMFEAELSAMTGAQTEVLRSAATGVDGGWGIGFAITKQELREIAQQLADYAVGDAVIWIAYPKQSSKRYQCEFNRDTGRANWDALGKAGFEPVRQVAMDEDWSALRFRRVEHIQSMTRNPAMTISKEGRQRALRKKK